MQQNHTGLGNQLDVIARDDELVLNILALFADDTFKHIHGSRLLEAQEITDFHMLAAVLDKATVKDKAICSIQLTAHELL